MRLLFIALALLLVMPASARGEDEPFHAGVARIAVAADVPFDALIWYPAEVAGPPWQVGPFLLPASHGAKLAAGVFPILLLSHGGGESGGSPLILSGLSAALARHGFVVVAPFHGTAALSLRPLQIQLALDAVLDDPRFKPHVDPGRLGMLGFSLGGAVTLELAGAMPDWSHLTAYCSIHPDDEMSCNHGPRGPRGTGRPAVPSALPLKAIVLLDPFAVPFQRDGLTNVTMPALLFRPEQSALSADGNAAALVAALPHPPRYETLPGGHFVFADVCTLALLAAEPALCRDPPGVDRAAIHRGIETKIAAFFRDSL